MRLVPEKTPPTFVHCIHRRTHKTLPFVGLNGGGSEKCFTAISFSFFLLTIVRLMHLGYYLRFSVFTHFFQLMHVCFLCISQYISHFPYPLADRKPTTARLIHCFFCFFPSLSVTPFVDFTFLRHHTPQPLTHIPVFQHCSHTCPLILHVLRRSTIAKMSHRGLIGL